MSKGSIIAIIIVVVLGVGGLIYWYSAQRAAPGPATPAAGGAAPSAPTPAAGGSTGGY